MFMHRQLKQGRMFQLGSKSNKVEQSSEQNSFRTVTSAQTDEQIRNDEIEYKPPPFTNFRDFDVEQIAAQNNIAVVCCGAIMCLLCSAIGIGLFYFFVFDYVKPYLPFYSVEQDPLKYLTQLNAKQYFAVNPMYAGQFHYARIPVEYWSHRIDMAKSMGLNSLSVYVFWNYHQISKGNFDFETTNKNLTKFLQLCKQKNMKVLLRPGPYVCAEWDFGGLPARLLNVQGMKIRSSNKLFIQETRIYFEQLHKVINKYVLNEKNPQGSILMIQVQNEPAWFTSQVIYITQLKKLWDNIGVGCPLYFDDTTKGLTNSTLYWENAIIGMNPPLYKNDDFDYFKKSNNFVFGGEVYSGWFTTWGIQDKWEMGMTAQYVTNFTNQFSGLLADNRSFSVYLVHGGTNFGLTAGYNITTSYDYFAPVSEQGRPTSNYHIFRSLVMNHTEENLPRIPSPIKTMQVTLGQLVPISSLFDNVNKSTQILNSKEPFVFESQQLQMYNQGFVLYETTLKGPKNYDFDTIIHDIALVYIDGQYNQTVYRTQANIKRENQELKINCVKQSCQLQILVEAMGHLNFGDQMSFDKKGILKFIQKDPKQSVHLTWKHYGIDINDVSKWTNKQKCDEAPCLYQIQVDLYQTDDTYINVKQLKKGYIWVNGHNLGRYWQIGPQYSVYCPGVWLKKGQNKILVLDLFQSNANVTLKGEQKMRMGKWI